MTLARDLYEVLRLILQDDESNRGSCPCGACHVKVTRQREAWNVMRRAEAAFSEEKTQ